MDSVPLSTKYTEAQGGAGAAFGALAGLVPFLLLARRSHEWGQWTLLAGFVLLVALTGAFAALSAARGKARLEGSVLVLSWLRTQRCDLATADIEMDHGRENPLNGPNIPRLIACDRATGRTLRLELRTNGGGLLPPAELRALADAMTAADRPAGSPALRYADRLRALADAPAPEPG